MKKCYTYIYIYVYKIYTYIENIYIYMYIKIYIKQYYTYIYIQPHIWNCFKNQKDYTLQTARKTPSQFLSYCCTEAKKPLRLLVITVLVLFWHHSSVPGPSRFSCSSQLIRGWYFYVFLQHIAQRFFSKPSNNKILHSILKALLFAHQRCATGVTRHCWNVLLKCGCCLCVCENHVATPSHHSYHQNWGILYHPASAIFGAD